jgi:prophage antirepressor-like protein
MSAVQPFQFDGADVRVVTDEQGEPWFVLADLCRVLGIARTAVVAARLDDDVKGVCQTDTLGGRQSVTTVTEAGMYDVIVRSDSPAAKPFRRWVTHEVLPAIRKTGGYQVTELSPRQLAQLVIAEADRADRAEAVVAELEPKAQVADRLLDAGGDLAVADAAKALRSRAGVPMGRDRLFSLLHTLGWIYRGGDGRWHAKQTAIEVGRLSILPMSHYHPRTGELVLDPPAIRVTPKGLQYLLRHLTTAEIGAAS